MKKAVTKVLAMMLVSTSLFGCGSAQQGMQNGNTKETTSNETEEIELKMFHNWTIDSEVAYFKEAADVFHKEHPNVVIKIENVGDPDYSTKLKVMMGTDDAPDIFFSFSGESLNKYVRAGHVLDLESYYEEDSEWNESFVPASKNPFENEEGIYAVPFRITTKQMVYNKDLFDEYQVSVPTTWDEFLNVCEVFKEAGIIPQAFGDLEAWAVCHYMTTFNTLCVPDDVRKADSDSETCTYTDPGYVQALNMLKQLQDNGYFTPNTNAIDFDVAREDFLIGNAAMAYLENIEYVDVENAGINAGIFSIPSPAGAAGNDKMVTGSVDGFAVSANCKNPEIAVEFLKLLTSMEWQEKAMGMSCTSVIKGAHNSDNSNELMLEDAKICETTEGFTNWMDMDMPSEISDVYLPGMQEIIAGTVTPEELMKKVQVVAENIRNAEK